MTGLADILGLDGLPATTGQADAAWAAGPKTPRRRTAWKILRDPHYQDCYRAYGEQAVHDAGWFDDGTDETRPYDLRLLSTPAHKLARPDGGQAPVVLLSTGAFSPVHDGHLAMMHAARDAVQAAGRQVIGGYLAPGHDDYVSTKYDGTAALDAGRRLRLCAMAVADSDWLMVDPWGARHVATEVNLTDVLRRLRAYLRRHTAIDDLDVWYVCGADNAAFARAFVSDAGCVIVPRTGHEPAVQDVLADPVMSTGRVLICPPTGQAAVSSRRIREALDAGRPAAGLPGCIRGTYDRWRRVMPRADGIYAVRDDLDWACEPWQHHVAAAELKDGGEQLRAAICDALRRALATHDPAPEVQLLDIDAQQQQIRRMQAAGEQVITLDVCTGADQRIDCCRVFGLADGQVQASALTARPGRPTLAEQAAAIPAGSYVLADDDIATGFTMDAVEDLLGDAVQITRRVGLLDGEVACQPVFDVIDLADMLLGARDRGLVCRAPDGQLTRAIYALPYVTPAARARLDPAAETAFSCAVWQANIIFHDRTGLTVADADPACRALLTQAGFADADQLADVARWHLCQLSDLPFRRV